MTPTFIVMDAVEELRILDSYLGGYDFKESYTDKVLRSVYERLRRRNNAMASLEDYLEQFQREEVQYGEILAPRIRKLFEAAYQQLLDKQIYRWDDTLPYAYERRMGTRTIILTLKGTNRSLVTYHLSGLPS